MALDAVWAALAHLEARIATMEAGRIPEVPAQVAA